MNQLHYFFRKKITYAQAILEDYDNKKQILALNYKVGDYIFVDIKNFCFEQPSKKLDFKFYGPYLIDKIIGLYIYQLSLPPDSNTHLVSYINKFCLALDNPFSS